MSTKVKEDEDKQKEQEEYQQPKQENYGITKVHLKVRGNRLNLGRVNVKVVMK